MQGTPSLVLFYLESVLQRVPLFFWTLAFSSDFIYCLSAGSYGHQPVCAPSSCVLVLYSVLLNSSLKSPVLAILTWAALNQTARTGPVIFCAILSIHISRANCQEAWSCAARYFCLTSAQCNVDVARLLWQTQFYFYSEGFLLFMLISSLTATWKDSSASA